MVPSPTTHLAGCEIIRPLASGGMGEILLARKTCAWGFSKRVVIKRMLPQFVEDPEFIRMFATEARVAGMMNHKNLVQVFECGSDDGVPYMMMEYVKGLSLRELQLRLFQVGERVPAPLLAVIAIQVLEGLHHAHELRDEEGRLLGVVHRDISPANVLLGFDGSVKLLDFGVARLSAYEPVTEVPSIKGRVIYMPPEQINNTALDRRADLFALGAMLYEYLSNVRPFKGDTPIQLIDAVLQCEPVPLERVMPTVNPAFAAVVKKAMSKNPDDRYATALEMCRALREVVGAQGANVASLVRRVALPKDGISSVSDTPIPMPPGIPPVTPIEVRRLTEVNVTAPNEVPDDEPATGVIPLPEEPPTVYGPPWGPTPPSAMTRLRGALGTLFGARSAVTPA